ncbi:hypothetical protein G9A89_019347 [Geosiphon pyriformis]|nr:hypothetical protein G9A89_019347 [Geosiphon pyriformis]
MATRPEFQPPVATFKNPAPTKNLPLNLRKIQHYQPLKSISSLGLMTKEQDYQPYQYGPVKKDLNETKECDWNNIPGRGGTYNTTCQYMILIYDWVRRGMPFKAVFNRALRKLQHYSHDEDKLYNITQAKVRGKTAEEIRHWKVSAEIANEVANYNMFDSVDKFQENYQQLCPTRQEQEQYLAQINTYFCKNCLIPCQSQ